MFDGNVVSLWTPLAKASKSSICCADFSARFKEMCFATMSFVKPYAKDDTDRFYVGWSMRNDNVGYLSLLVHMVLI